MNRRNILKAVPVVAVIPVVQTLVGKRLLALSSQETALSGNQPDLSLLRSDQAKLSLSVQNALETSLKLYVLHSKQGKASEVDAASFAQMLAVYLGNLQECGWNTHLDQFIKSNPDFILYGSVSSPQAERLLDKLQSYGITSESAISIQQRTFLTQEDRKTLIEYINQHGSAELFKRIGDAITLRLTSSVSASVLRSGLKRIVEHSTECKWFAGIVLIGTLTGNEVAAAVALYGYMAYC